MNTAIIINILTNDIQDGTATITSITQPSDDSSTFYGGILGPGEVLYQPSSGFLGTATFDYTICQTSNADCDSATVTVDVLPVVPKAVDDFEQTTMNTPVIIDVLENDIPSGSLLVNSIAVPPGHGDVFFGGTLGGGVEYFPVTGYQGTDTFTYQACDSYSQCDTAVVTVVIDHHVVLALNDYAYTPVGTPVTISVLTNDVGNDLTVSNIPSQPTHGVASRQEDGTIVYNPTGDYIGLDMFVYTMCGNTDCDEATVLINMINAVDDETSTPYDTPVTINVLTNDNGEDLEVVEIPTQPPNGEVGIMDNGSVMYTPNKPFAGQDIFTYLACVADTNVCDEATVTVDVILAVDDETSTLAGTPVTIDVLNNDHGEDLEVTDFPTQPVKGGSVTINDQDGTLEYIPPDNDSVGNDIFTYTACITESNVCDTATVTINVIEAVNDEISTPVGIPVAVGVLDNDDGQNLEVTNFPAQPVNGGAITINDDGTVEYTPPDDESVVEDTFTYMACIAGTNFCDTATVTATLLIPVAPVVAVDDYAYTPVGTPVTISVLSNDSGEDLIVTVIPGQPSHGVATLQDDGTIVYTSTGDHVGPDMFIYTMCGTTGSGCDTATVRINAIDALDDATSTQYGTPVMINVLFNDVGENLEVVKIPIQPPNGEVDIDDNGLVTYTPKTPFAGEDTFTYLACVAETSVCAEATVVVDVILAVDDKTSTLVGVPLEIDVLDNDQGENLEVTAFPTQPVNGGSIVINDEDGTVEYIPPDDDSVEEDIFTYTACIAGTNVCDEATVTINVIETVNDETSTPVGTSVTINVLDNDHGQNLELTEILTQPVNGGSVVINDEYGTVEYTPPDDISVGGDFFDYVACVSGTNFCDTATVVATILTPVVSVVAVNDYVNIPAGTPVTISVLNNDSGDGLTVIAIPSQPDNGDATLQDDGTIVYTPTGDHVGLDSFSYTTCGTTGSGCDMAVVYVNIIDAVDDQARTPYGTPVTINVLTNDAGDDLKVVEIPTQPPNGEVEIDENGLVAYTPNIPFAGEDTFTYLACVTETSVCDMATVTIDVILAVDDETSTPVGSPVPVDVLNNDLGQDLEVMGFPNQPANGGAVAINDDGTVEYAPPDDDFVGDDTFTYMSCVINTNMCDTATVTVTMLSVVNDSETTPVGAPVVFNVLINDFGEELTVYNYTYPGVGDVTIQPDGTAVYNPGDASTGDVTLTYTACEARNTNMCDAATITITVMDIVDDEMSTPSSTQAIFNVLLNDIGVDLEVVGNTNPLNGDVTVAPDGSVVYNPVDDFVGDDTFTYTACESATPSACGTATVSVVVLYVNEPPMANPDVTQVPMNTPIIIQVLDNDTDPDGDSLVVCDVTSPDQGFVSISPNQQYVTYIPVSGFSGVETFEYIACDGETLQDGATVTITVNPDVANDLVETQEGIPVDKYVLNNDSGSDMVISSVAPAANGICTIEGSGTFIRYTPTTFGFVGQDECMYTSCTQNTPACASARLVVRLNGAPTDVPSESPSAPPTEAWYYPDYLNDEQGETGRIPQLQH